MFCPSTPVAFFDMSRGNGIWKQRWEAGCFPYVRAETYICIERQGREKPRPFRSGTNAVFRKGDEKEENSISTE